MDTTLVRQKGADVLLRAFATVVKQIPTARLRIAGDGPDSEHLARLVRDLGLSSSVSMLGWLDSPALELCRRDAWAQVVPSRWAESFANVAAEAMMRGTAVIASATGGMTEYVRDGRTGILVSPGDEQALAAALATLLRDRDLAEEMGRCGREIALAELTDEACADRFLALYGALCAGAGAREC